MFRIGPYQIGSQTVLAPMAGVSDQPFRALCTAQGAGLVVSEMVTSDTRLWHSNKSQQRLQWLSQHSPQNETKTVTPPPKSVQIAGSDPQQMAEAAAACVERGADIVDINMGCPAKKVCNKAAGSALLRDESLVAAILESVVSAVDVPVTLKIRTGWDRDNKNASTIARIAELSGIQALTIHGRTRACRFNGYAEYDTIAKICGERSIPVIANGDIDSPQKAQQVLLHTGAQAVMIGRAAQGNPWIFRDINAFLADGTIPERPNLNSIYKTVMQHLAQLHQFYGEVMGPRIARKHVAWYLAKQVHADTYVAIDDWRRQFNTLITLQEQLNTVHSLFERLHQLEDQAA